MSSFTKCLKLSAAALALGSSIGATAALAGENASLEFLGRYESGFEGGTEIVAFDERSKRLFVTNGETGAVDILSLQNPSAPTKVGEIAINGEPTHVTVSRGRVAVAVNVNDGESRGEVQFFNAFGAKLGAVTVGFLPDMVTFSRNGRYAVVANEGEPTDNIDPRGSVSIIDLRRGVDRARTCEADFSGFDAGDLDDTVRLFPDKTPEFDFEPEFVGVEFSGRKAFVALQEANAVATVDIRSCKVTRVSGLGFKDHSLEGNGIDPSDRDDAINIAPQPVYGLYQPDGLKVFRFRGDTYYLTANEGDARDEDDRVGDLDLDPTAFPNAAELQENEALGRLEVSTVDGDTDGDGDFDKLFSYGARSFSIYSEAGEQIFDSGDDLEQITAAALPDNFNANDDDNSFDSRSDAKGPEPEGTDIGRIGGKRYAFVGLERVGGVVTYDITDPYTPQFCDYTNTRDFSVEEISTSTDLAPEGLLFIPANESPNREPLLVVAYEVSGTIGVFEVKNGRNGCSAGK